MTDIDPANFAYSEAVQDDVEGEVASERSNLETLLSYIDHPNIADELDAETLGSIGQECLRGYELDKASRSEWERQTKAAMDLALQVAEKKSWPWPNAANVKYPLITTAAIQFAARAYPAIIPGADVVKGAVNGRDEDGSKLDRARRIGQHMSYQLLEEMEEWEEDTDKLLLQMAIVGCAFRKTYYDSTLGRNVSELAPAKHVVFDHATPFRKLRRISHELFLCKNDVLEKVRGDVWRDIELGMADGASSDDEDGTYEFIEQHSWYDLDEDGYKEPYSITFRKESGEVVRVVARYDQDGVQINARQEVARIKQVEYWTKYGFMPNPDGGSYDIGLGILLNPINETINTVLNQLLDAGTVANTGGGFIGKGLRMKAGPMRFSPGEYKPVDAQGSAIRDNIVPLQFPDPSPVLFNLLGLLIEAGKDIANVKDVLSGEQNQSNVPATTTLALIEQGLKVFTAIYKRVHRSLKQEFRKLYRLNKLYLPPESYFRFHDMPVQILLEDYAGDETDITPVSDPHLVTDAQVMAKAQALMNFNGDPHINQMEIRKRFLIAIKEENIEALLQEPPPPPQDPKVAEIMGNLQIKAAEMEAKIEKMKAETIDTQAAAVLKVAQAEAQEIGNQLQIYMQQAHGIAMLMQQHMEMMGNGQSAVQGMAGASNDGGGDGVPPTVPPITDGGMGGGELYPADDRGIGDEAGGSVGEGAVLPGSGEPGI